MQLPSYYPFPSNKTTQRRLNSLFGCGGTTKQVERCMCKLAEKERRSDMYFFAHITYANILGRNFKDAQ
jgi:hypothetical protein